MDIEWKNGDECFYDGSKYTFVGMTPVFNDTSCIIFDSKNGIEHVCCKKLSKPETPQQREKRERLEAAYDLYLTQCLAGRCDQFTYEEFIKEKFLVKIWLPIVDKTDYRKQ